MKKCRKHFFITPLVFTNAHLNRAGTSSLKTLLYRTLGFTFLGIAVLGYFLPVLPGTPFLLLSAWFFARSSPYWHQRLLDSNLFGPMIHNWETNRCISRQTKVVAIASMLVVGGASVTFGVSETWIRVLALALMGVGCGVVLSIKTCDGAEARD